MQSGPPSPSDRIALALWRRGALQAALEVAHAAVVRGDPRQAACRALMEQLRSGQGPKDQDPVPDLDLALVAALLDLGWLAEARAVLSGGAIRQPGAVRLANVLDEAMAVLPPEADPSFGAVLQLIREGHAASALRAIDEVVRASAPPPGWLLERQRALATVLRGTWRDEPEPVAPMTRDTVLARIRARDLPAALAAARSAGAAELAEVLARLLEATERVFTDSIPDSDDAGTVPIEGHRLAELHIRMGVLLEADRSYRAMLREDPEEERARTMLADVIALRRALGESPEPMPPRPGVSVGWLSKNAPRSSAQNWAAGTGGRYAAWGDEPDDDSTANMEPAQEAELLVKLGRAQQALSVYRILATRHPKQQVYRKRITEIEALIAQNVSPMSEATMQLDLSDLSAQAVPTNPRVRRADFPLFSDEDDGPTKVERRRDDE